MTTIPSTPATLPESPLTEVDPESLNELIARDPLELTSQNIKTIVTQLRAQRILWEREEASSKKTGKRANAKKALSPTETKKLLENLELDI